MILNEAGMHNTEVVPRIAAKEAAINEVMIFIPQVFIDEDRCSEGIKSLQNFRREWDEKMAEWKNRPREDWAMHGYDAFETLVRGLEMYGDAVAPPPRRVQPAVDWRAI